MKKALFTLALFGSLAATAAPQTTVPTLMTCQQSDGDQWLEVGITSEKGSGLKALVVSHDTDLGTSNLIAEYQVFELSRGNLRVFQNREQTIRVVIVRNSMGETADLNLAQDGRNFVRKSGLVCFMKSSIGFDN